MLLELETLSWAHYCKILSWSWYICIYFAKFGSSLLIIRYMILLFWEQVGGLCSLGWSPEDTGLGIMVLQLQDIFIGWFGSNLVCWFIIEVQLVCCTFFYSSWKQYCKLSNNGGQQAPWLESPIITLYGGQWRYKIHLS